MRGGAKDTATFLRSKPHICGLTTQIMSFNILNEEKTMGKATRYNF